MIQVKRILLASDFLMTKESEQDSNLRWLRDLYASPIGQACGTRIRVASFYFDRTWTFSRDTFFKKSTIDFSPVDVHLSFDPECLSEASLNMVSVAHVPRRFAVYGAIARPGNIEIPTAAAHLAYLLAEVGGLNDKVSEARSVFVFRPPASSDNSGTSPAIAYRFDFSRPDAFLLAGLFKLQPTDITYIASADAADFQKFVSIFRNCPAWLDVPWQRSDIQPRRSCAIN